MRLEELPVIELRGTPYERGLIHGESVAGKARDVFGDWQYMVEKVTGKPLDTVVQQFCGATRFRDAMARWTPGLLDEIRGIATASNINFDALYMFNCTDENGWFLDYLTGGDELPEARGCSSFGTLEAEGTFIGQNMDIPGATEGFQVLLHVIDEENEVENLLFSLAGMLGMIGLSSAPVGVVNNSLKQLRQRVDGLPVNMVVRGLLMQKDLRAARAFIESAPHATGHNYIIADREAMAMYECSANQVREVSHDAYPGRLVHTNHPILNDDLLGDAAMNENRSSSNTHDRLTAMSDAVLNEAPMNLLQMKAALSSHSDPENPVCRHVGRRSESFSAGSVVYDMTRAELHIAPGPPCETDFGQFGFNR